MIVRRRPFSGRPLLVASAGAALVLAGCTSGTKDETDTVFTSGNLIAPPTFELCVTVEPVTATVTVDGTALPKSGCADVYEGSHDLAAEAKGYVPYAETIDVLEDTTYPIVMEPK
jgi:hypothetical protein